MSRAYVAFCFAVLLPAGNLVHKDLPPRSRWDPRALNQSLPPEIRQDQYVREFVKIIDKWNTETAVFPVSAKLRAHFVDNLKEAVERKWQGYETAKWADGKLMQFDELAKKKQRPQLKLDHEAALTLTLAFAINLPSMQARFKPDSLGEELALPTYLIFSKSQQLALQAERSFITSEDVSRAIFSLWTTVWPFCAPAEKKPA